MSLVLRIGGGFHPPLIEGYPKAPIASSGESRTAVSTEEAEAASSGRQAGAQSAYARQTGRRFDDTGSGSSKGFFSKGFSTGFSSPSPDNVLAYDFNGRGLVRITPREGTGGLVDFYA